MTFSQYYSHLMGLQINKQTKAENSSNFSSYIFYSILILSIATVIIVFIYYCGRESQSSNPKEDNQEPLRIDSRNNSQVHIGIQNLSNCNPDDYIIVLAKDIQKIKKEKLKKENGDKERIPKYSRSIPSEALYGDD